jgi:hypothetical protein
MQYQSYTGEEIQAAETQSCRDAGCEPLELAGGGIAYDCTNVAGESRHPIADALAEAVEMANVAVQTLELRGWRPAARIIETPAELDALHPAHAIVAADQEGRNDLAAVIETADGDVLTRDMLNLPDEIATGRHAGWWESGRERDDIDSSTVAFPVTVLREPKELNTGE